MKHTPNLSGMENSLDEGMGLLVTELTYELVKSGCFCNICKPFDNFTI